MLVTLCNCNRHFSFLPSKTLQKPPSHIRSCYYPKFPIKSSRRRFSISAAAVEADRRTLPQSAIHRIAEKLRSLGYVEEEVSSKDEELIPGPNSPGEIFVPFPTRLPKHRVGHTLDTSWSTPENPVPEPGSGNAIQRFHELRRGVLEEKERIKKRSERKKSAPSLAELTLPAEELRRLTTSGIALKKKLKVGKAGITEGIVNGIHERWRRSELVKITCDDICRLNMKRTHGLLEKKTGGLVIWRSGSNIILYRGPDYKYPYFLTDKTSNDSSSEESPDNDKDQEILGMRGVQSPVTHAVESSGLNSDLQISRPPLIQGVGLPNRVRFQLPGEAQLAEEVDALLEGLGPRFRDWWSCDPLPVDADLLPAVVPGYKRPFRLLPYGVKPKLTNDEMTILKRLGRPLPCHFALGRNRRLQGLAAAIVKLWEKCEIAKIAIKRGVQNTNSELMAEEIKWLTGGTLLSRDREFFVFYRGKDFLPATVSSALEKRRKYGMDVSETRRGNLSIGKEKEHTDGAEEYAAEDENDKENQQKLQSHSETEKVRFSETAMEKTSTKLSMALEKKARAEELLAELEKKQIPQQSATDKEGITEEERYMLRKIGLRMKAFLLLGRRGVFDGTIENMHLHWKYRELVKVCISRRSIEEVHGIAQTLEAESGGILVAVERVSKGYAIIVYRGKNYKRPASLRPRTLLSKREAMKRSLEAQRFKSLKLHVLKLNRHIDGLRLRMEKDNKNDVQLTQDFKCGAVDQENNENHTNVEISHSHPKNDRQSYFTDPADENHNNVEISHSDPKNDHQTNFIDYATEAKEIRETDATATEQENTIPTTNETLDFTRLNVPGDVALGSAVDGNFLFGKTETALQLESLPNETKVSLNINEQRDNVQRSEGPTRSSTASYTQPRSGGREYNVGSNNAKLETSVQNAINEKPQVKPFMALQLSNKERLLLRKQALKIRKPPVLAVGKSNVITGVAKTIKEHFKKHPLAIVNIKGRAKGTSAQEVIYNLQQATGSVLVSLEPSKVILYRGWGSGIESDKASVKLNRDSKHNLLGGELKAQPIISPELISAIRVECGLKSIDEEHDELSEVATDGSIDEIPCGSFS